MRVRLGDDEVAEPFLERVCFAPTDALVYGPLTSRRCERFLGVNLTPAGARVCSSDCVYCDVGSAMPTGGGLRWRTPGAIGSALTSALYRSGPVDQVVILGRGEPTLHPHFCAVMAEVVAAARRSSSRPELRIFTNGARAIRGDVRRALNLLDARVVRLDAAPEPINRPAARYPRDLMACGLGLLKDVDVHSCFVDGPVSNLDEQSVRQWMNQIAELKPRFVEIYTIPRNVSECGARPVSTEQLEATAEALRERARVEVHVLPGESSRISMERSFLAGLPVEARAQQDGRVDEDEEPKGSDPKCTGQKRRRQRIETGHSRRNHAYKRCAI